MEPDSGRALPAEVARLREKVADLERQLAAGPGVRQEAEELARVARLVSETLDLATVGERIAEGVLGLLGVHTSALRLVQPDGSLVGIAAGGRAREYEGAQGVVPAGIGLVGLAATAQRHPRLRAAAGDGRAAGAPGRERRSHPPGRAPPARPHQRGARDQPDRDRAPAALADNLSNLRLIESILSQRPGVSLLSAMQGRVGLDLARAHGPDLILLDRHLPDISGEQVFVQLREDPRTRDIPVIVLSADAISSGLQRLRDAGVRASLTKPLDVRQLLEVIDESLRPAPE